MPKLLRLTIIFSVFLSGCASPLMKPSSDAVEAVGPEPGKAQVVFLRPSSFGGVVQSTVYDLDPEGDRFIGIVSSSTKVSYQAAPGEHLFMVIGESADFMRAHVLAGKTYYALVSPRFGVWKARFSLLPVHAEQHDSEEFADWRNSTKFVTNTAASEQWAKDNWDSIQSKKNEYMPKWVAKSAADQGERTLWDKGGR